MKLDEKDIRILNTFSLYLQSFGSRIGKFSVDVGTDGDVDWYYSEWMGDGTKMRIPSYDAVDELLKKIYKENEDIILYDIFGSDDRGSFTFIINVENKTLTMSANVYQMETEYTADEYEWDDIYSESVKNWFLEKSQDHRIGTVNYEGSGDSGYIEQDIRFENGERESCPADVEEFLYGKLSYYGGWEINEGSQGEFKFLFDKKKILHEHGSNYESESVSEIPLEFRF